MNGKKHAIQLSAFALAYSGVGGGGGENNESPKNSGIILNPP